MLLSSLPHIPDLIQADSPVCRVIGANRDVLRGIVLDLDEHTIRVATEHGVVERWEHGGWELDLTRRHGRADAAWWAYRERVAKLEAAHANDVWNPSQSPLCGWCPVKTCPFNPQH